MGKKIANKYVTGSIDFGAYFYLHFFFWNIYNKQPKMKMFLFVENDFFFSI